MTSLLLAILAIFCTLICASPLYEDEVGVIDWTIQNVGTPIDASFHPQKRYVYVSTAKNVLAALSLKTGEIAWRRVFDKTTGRVTHKGNVVLLSVDSGAELYLLDNTDGSIVWNIPTQSVSGNVDVLFVGDVDGDGVEDISLLCGGQIQLRSGRDGQSIWSTQLNSGKNGRLHHDVSKNVLYVVEPQLLTPINLQSGEKSEGKTLAGNTATSFFDGSSSGEYFYATGVSGIVSLQSGKSSWTSHNIDNQAILSNIQINGNAAIVAGSLQENSKVRLFVVEDNKFREEVFSLVSNVTNNSHIKNLFLDVYNTKDMQRGYRILIVHSDGLVSLYSAVPRDSHQILEQWSREEGLGDVSSFVMMDLPSVHVYTSYMKEVGSSQGGLLSQFAHRIHAQFTQFLETISGGVSVPTTSEARPYADQMGFRKIVVAVSRAGKLFGLQTDSGAVVWTHDVSKKCQKPEDLVVVRKSSHFPPQTLLICRNDENTELIWFNPLDGSNVTTQNIPGNFKKTISIPLSVREEKLTGDNYIVIVVDSDNNVHVASPHGSAGVHEEAFNTIHRSVFWHVAEKNGSVVEGYTVGKKVGRYYESDNVWTVPLGTTGRPEHILSASYANWEDTVASAARVLGNRDALPKYLNRNMFAVASTSESPPSIQVYLIDGVSGAVVHSTMVSGATGPVHMELVENWIVFTYFSVRYNRFEISVLEAFEQKLDWKETRHDSYISDKPYFLQQTYVLPMSIRSITTSSTMKGITPKQLLFATTTDQIITFSKSLLDPRRPSKEKMTQEDREEGLWPYDPELPLNHRTTLSHYRQIKGVDVIKTAPSNLESTSVVFASGLDLFFTRTAAANSFDVLNPDFNFPALLITTGGLLVATIISVVYSAKVALARSWK